MGPAVPTMEGIVNFHNHVMIVILFIVLFVAWLMINLINYFNSFTVTKNANFTHSNVLEIIWTSIPALILVVLATPSFTLLYSMDELIDPVINFKIIGHQWYWSAFIFTSTLLQLIFSKFAISGSRISHVDFLDVVSPWPSGGSALLTSSWTTP